MNEAFPSGLVGPTPQHVESLRSPTDGREASLVLPAPRLVELERHHLEALARVVPGGAGNIQDIYPLTPLQEGMLFHRLLNERRDTYVLSTLFELQSEECITLLSNALQRVINRHDVLRSSVLWQDLPRPLQVVHREAPVAVERITLSTEVSLSAQIDEWTSPLYQSIDLAKAPLVRLQVAADPLQARWLAVLRVHHLLCDHQSLSTMVAEMMACIGGRERQLPMPMPFRSHVAEAVTTYQEKAAEEFFKSKLADLDESTAPFGIVDAKGGARIEEAREELDADLTQQIRVQARRYGVSAARLFHAAWSLVIARTSGRMDVSFGTVLLAGRSTSAKAQCMLGMSVSTLPLRVRLRGVSAQALVEQVQRELTELLAYAQTPLAMAQRCSGVAGTAPLFTALLNYRHKVRGGDVLAAGEAGIRVLSRGEAWTNYPITLTVDDLVDRFVLMSHTDPRIGAVRMLRYLTMALQSLLKALEEDPNRQALSLSVLPQSEWQQLVRQFNATQVPYPQEKLVHELFEEQVRRTPEAEAVRFGGHSLSYGVLNARANRLARHLLSRGTRSDELIGICVNRGLNLVVGVLGILKAGAAYVPLDPNYPKERLQYMLEDSGPSLVVTERELQPSLPAMNAEFVVLDAEEAAPAVHDPSAAELALKPQNLVYVIYTSGSTGRPKGTAMAHASMVNLLAWHHRHLPLAPQSRVLQFAALSFDVAFQEIFSTLTMGGTLVLLDEWVRRDARELIALLISQQIERLFIPPIMLQSLAEAARSASSLPTSLKDVITAGEQLRITPEIVAFFARIAACRLHNHYGPTETHVVTALTLRGAADGWPAQPTIGRPISNTQIYLLNEQREPMPHGIAGELYIGGANVARGYLHRQELTIERFIADPFSTELDARMYKTGDLARWRADGSIEYIGRNDDQVKIRGFRVEIGEIETQIARHPLVREAAVIVREDDPGERRLVAYVTPRDERGPSSEDLRAGLKDVLPEHMVPSAFVTLQALPLTPSGKLNRRALPPPDLAAYASCREYEPPQGELEEIVASIWRDVLRVSLICRNDSFFDLGGHSLLAMQVLTRLRGALAIEVQIRSMFEFPTLRQLCGHVEELRNEGLGIESEQALLETVLSLPDSDVRRLLREMTEG